MTAKISIFDCGCVPSRPRDPSCKTFGTRWRAFVTCNFIKLKCRDCGRIYDFELRKEGVQRTSFDYGNNIENEAIKNGKDGTKNNVTD